MGFRSRLQQQDSCQSIRKSKLFTCYQHQPCDWRAAAGTSGGRSPCLSLTLEVTPLDTATIPMEIKFTVVGKSRLLFDFEVFGSHRKCIKLIQQLT